MLVELLVWSRHVSILEYPNVGRGLSLPVLMTDLAPQLLR